MGESGGRDRESKRIERGRGRDVESEGKRRRGSVRLGH